MMSAVGCMTNFSRVYGSTRALGAVGSAAEAGRYDVRPLSPTWSFFRAAPLPSPGLPPLLRLMVIWERPVQSYPLEEFGTKPVVER